MSKTDSAKKQADFVVRYALQSFGMILLLAILIRTFLLSSYVMSGASMLPGIWPGDFLVGFKWRLVEPHRGEVVILKCPNQKERICLKRVVGIAGDRIEFKAGHLVVNGQTAKFKALGGEFGQESVESSSWPVWPGTDAMPNSKEPVIVPPQYVYVLNDKRQDSDDSRSWGPLPTELLEARASRVWLSLDWFEKDGQVRSWPRVRWSRMLRSID
jgi:signal peptidase I